jgi:hypothetical protein
MSEAHPSTQQVSISTHHSHLIPVGTADKRPILPISREHLETDEVILYPLSIDNKPKGLNELVKILDGMLGLDTTVTEPLETVHTAYTTAYEDLQELLSKDRESKLWVNIAGASSTCSAAFSQAATALQMEVPDQRPNISVYTVSDDGKPEPIGCAPSAPPTDIGETILRALFNSKAPDSITELARRMCGGELDASFRSKIQYNVKKLEKQGYVRRKGDHRMRPLLTPTGEMWAQTHGYHQD